MFVATPGARMQLGGYVVRKLLLATAAALGLAASGGVAHAQLQYTIWNGSGFDHAAEPPGPSSTPFALFSDPGNPINFVNNGPDTPDGSDNLFSEFFTPAVLAECNAANSACGTTVMSTLDSENPEISTFIKITGLMVQGGSVISISHDDGGTIYDGSTLVAGNSAESSENTESGIVPGTGLQDLTIYYTEDNGAPSILQVAVPEPMSLVLVGSGVIGLGLVRRRKKA
jgi:hypothetical protein